MNVNTEEQMALLNGLSDYSAQVIKNSPSWLADFRRKNLERFQELGIPTVKHEEWKYTNVADLAGRIYRTPGQAAANDVTKLKGFIDPNDINIVFVNGVLSKELSSFANLPKGLTYKSLSEAVKADRKLEDYLNRTTANDPESFVALNNALYADGAYLAIADKAVIDQLVHIVHLTSGTESTASFPRTLITVGKLAEAQILESFFGFQDAAYLTTALTDIFVAEAAVITYCKSQAEGGESTHIGATRVWQEQKSQLRTFSLTAGAALTRNNLSVILEGEGTDSVLNGLYSMFGNQHVDNHSLVDHRYPNCTSYQLYKGILHDAARGVFNGKIYVKQIAQQTNSYQLNKNLLLGKECRVDTKPQLEIFADDVKCTHGATVGQLNEDELFYLQSRCIDKDHAVKMLSRGFVEDILNTIEKEAIRSKLFHLMFKGETAI